MNTNGIFSKASDEWETPKDLFYKLHHQYRFTLDPCATEKNALCNKFFTMENDGLKQSWEGERVFCNPPYSKVKEWVKKASEEKALTVMLIPARTDTSWFHDIVQKKGMFYFIRGRLKFSNSKNSAPFPSMIVLFNNLYEYDE